MTGEPVAEVNWSPVVAGVFTKVSVVATASVPAASTTMNGTILIEDGGIGVGKVIFYSGGQRFELVGVLR